MKVYNVLVTSAIIILLLFWGRGQDNAQATLTFSPGKVGYTDPDVIVAAMPEYREIQQKLQNEFQLKQQELQQQAADFQQKLEAYQTQQAMLSTDKRAEREKELQQLQADIQQASSKKDQELNESQLKMMEPLVKKVQDVIDETAKAKGLEMVFRSPALLYVNEATVVDITKEVAKKLGIPIPDEKK